MLNPEPRSENSSMARVAAYALLGGREQITDALAVATTHTSAQLV